MSHTNYNNVSNKARNENVNVNATPAQPEAPAAVIPDAATTAPVTAPEAPAQPEAIFGMVCDCKNLNIRKNPNVNSQILFTVPNGAKIKIDLGLSTAEWYKVTVNSKEGFCMKKYISLPQ